MGRLRTDVGSLNLGVLAFSGQDGGARRHLSGAEVGSGMDVWKKQGAATGEHFYSGKMV